MNKKNAPPRQFSALDSDTANEVLNNIYAACENSPNIKSVETLEEEANYLKPKVRIGRAISYIVLMALVLLPVLFFKPSITAERTNVDFARNATYEVRTNSFLPIREISASINGKSVSVNRSAVNCYLVDISENGTLAVEVTSFNGQTSVMEQEVNYIDTVKPVLVRSYCENGIVYMVLRDTYSGIDFDSLSAVGAGNQVFEAESVDEKEGIVSYIIPASPITFSVSDHAGNVLRLLISPMEAVTRTSNRPFFITFILLLLHLLS